MVTLWQELDQCYDDVWENPNNHAPHKKREENDRVYMFLAGFDRSLDEVRGGILGRKPLPSIREVFSQIRREGSRRKIMLRSNESSLNLEPGSSTLVSRNGDSDIDGRKKPWCENCRKPWHIKETCWKLHGKPANWKPKSKRDGRAYQAKEEEMDESSTNSNTVSFSKEQLKHLYKLFQSPKLSLTPSGSLTQKGNSLASAFTVSHLIRFIHG